jgi:ABC-type lipoprotein release transport system permease subunit
MVIRQVLALAGAGWAIGIISAVTTSGLAAGLLFGISPLDPITFAAIPVPLVGVAVIACWLPACRAVRVNPSTTLRAQGAQTEADDRLEFQAPKK